MDAELKGTARHSVNAKRYREYCGPIFSLGKSALVTIFTHVVGKVKILTIFNCRFIISEQTNTWSEILAPVKSISRKDQLFYR